MPFPDTTAQFEFEEDGWPIHLITAFIYLVSVRGRHLTIVAPVGFVTDLASVPRALWRIFPPFGKYTSAAIIHDYLYKYQPFNLTRKQCDNIFLQAMKESDVGWWSRKAMYHGVRAGGWIPFAKYKEELEL